MLRLLTAAALLTALWAAPAMRAQTAAAPATQPPAASTVNEGPVGPSPYSVLRG